MSDPRVDPSDSYNEALKNAAIGRHLQIVKLLLAEIRFNP